MSVSLRLFLPITVILLASCATTTQSLQPEMPDSLETVDGSALPNRALETETGFTGSALAYHADSAAAVRVSRDLAFRLAIALADDVLEDERGLLQDASPDAGGTAFILRLRLTVAGMQPTPGMDADCPAIALAQGGWSAECSVDLPKKVIAGVLREQAPDLWPVLMRSERLAGWVTSP